MVHDTAFSVELAWAEECGEGTGIAADDPVPGHLQEPMSAEEVAANAAEVGGGRWHRGRLLLTLHAWGDDSVPVTLVEVSTRRVLPAGPPLWRVTRTTGCAEQPEPDQVWTLDLDTQELELSLPGRPERGFQVNGAVALTPEPVVVAIDLRACRGNYRWVPELGFLTPEGQGTLPLDPQTVFGRAADTRAYTLGAGRSRPQWQGRVSGPDRSC